MPDAESLVALFLIFTGPATMLGITIGLHWASTKENA